MNEETLYAIALSMTPRISLAQRCAVVAECGSARAACERPALKDRITPYLARAEKEMMWTDSHGIRCIPFNDDRYPRRMRLCEDAPVVLYLMGNTDLNPERVLAIVGTRQINEYGRRLCQDFIKELAYLSPGTLIVSGLAYGVDVHAHKAALQHALPTVGVMAHGLDMVYPAAHRHIAEEMLDNGGALLTEFPSGTHIEKNYFAQRNRIVAGIADATIVIQGASKSGSMITANITDSYGRELFACPGRVGDELSEGCNRLIQSLKAHMMLSAHDLLSVMNWPEEPLRRQIMQQGVQPSLFPQLSDNEEKIVNTLRTGDTLSANEIAARTALPIGSLASTLFALEMKGVLRQAPGGRYHL